MKQQLRRRLLADETTVVASYMNLVGLLREALCKKTNRPVIRAFDIMPLAKETIKCRRRRVPTIQMHEDPTTGKKQGVRTLFSFAAGDNDELHARPLSCWCNNCLEGTSTVCSLKLRQASYVCIFHYIVHINARVLIRLYTSSVSHVVLRIFVAPILSFRTIY